jgi:hypothetical protein
MAYKKESTIINFEEGVPTTITLKTNPETAKEVSRTSKAGKPYTQYTYFTHNGEVFWAFKDLHEELKRFRANDTVTITKVTPIGAKFSVYKVEGDRAKAVPVTNGEIQLAQETNQLVKMLIQRFDTFLKSQGVTTSSAKVETQSEKTETPIRETNPDLGF